MFLFEIGVMRSTLDLPDPLFKHLKTRAAQERSTMLALLRLLAHLQRFLGSDAAPLPSRLWTDACLAVLA